MFTTLAHTDCVTLDPWASSHSVPPVQAVGWGVMRLPGGSPLPLVLLGKGLRAGDFPQQDAWELEKKDFPVAAGHHLLRGQCPLRAGSDLSVSVCSSVLRGPWASSSCSQAPGGQGWGSR